jgi:hypothetical protein
MLHLLGVPMHDGDDSGSNEWNQKGFFEDGEFGDVLGRHVYSHVEDKMENYMPADLPPIAGELKEWMVKLIQKRSARGIDWGVKSARLCYVLADFIAACPMPVKVIRVVRPETEAVASWQARTEHDEQAAATVIQNAQKVTEKALTDCGITPLVVSFAELANEPAREVKVIADFVGCAVTQEAFDFVTPDLKRF